MKKTIRTLAIFSLIMSGIYFGKWFIQTDYFKIREIPVSGDNALLKRSIVSKLEKLKGENIVYIDTKKIEKMVKEDVRVKNATIQKVFPSKLIHLFYRFIFTPFSWILISFVSANEFKVSQIGNKTFISDWINSLQLAICLK